VDGRNRRPVRFDRLGLATGGVLTSMQSHQTSTGCTDRRRIPAASAVSRIVDSWQASWDALLPGSTVRVRAPATPQAAVHRGTCLTHSFEPKRLSATGWRLGACISLISISNGAAGHARTSLARLHGPPRT
jgi:hypothetical protein